MIVAVAAQAAIAIDNARLHAASITAEQQYRALAESSPQLVWTTTPEGAVEYCNPQFLAYVGLSLEQMRREPVWDRHRPRRGRAQGNRRLDQSAVDRRTVRSRVPVSARLRWKLSLVSRPGCLRSKRRRANRQVGWLAARISMTTKGPRRRTGFSQKPGPCSHPRWTTGRRCPRLAHLAVPHMADWCSIQLSDSKGELERVAVAHADPHRLELIHEIEAPVPRRRERARLGASSARAFLSTFTSSPTTCSPPAARDPHHLDLIRLSGCVPGWPYRSW